MTEAFAARITRTPLPHDPARTVDSLDPALGDGPLGALIRGTVGSSPYLARLIARHGDWLVEALASTPEEALNGAFAGLETALGEADSIAPVRSALRRTKGRVALLAALADLGGVWDLAAVTGALTGLADRCTEGASRWLLAREAEAGRLPPFGNGGGYVLLAMGKMGAHELNYSSDIDLIALFDDGAFGADEVMEARARYIHVTRQMVQLLSENTDEGYVFRTDLRLRPAPSTTPVCMAISAALRYYESEGRTWERAAHIKARPLVDRATGAAYLQTLTPFVWRRHLDYAAIDDIHGMLHKIRTQRAAFGIGSVPGRDLKLDPGGIREIEFFAQTRQLITGGRDRRLRAPATVAALAALADAGQIAPDTAATLTDDYRRLRMLEHRLQMMEDAQTHRIPTGDDARQRLAMLCGTDDLPTFEAAIAEGLVRVHGLTEDLYRPATAPVPADGPDGNGTAVAAEALTAFDRPEDAARQLALWRDGRIPATRSDRARRLYAQLEPQILARLSGAANPDLALANFGRFLSGLPTGVQVFSLFSQNPELLDLIVAICAAAPRLAGYLGRHAQTLDALLDQDFWEPLPPTDALRADLDLRISAEADYERILDATRRWAREMGFRAGVQLLRGVSDPGEAGHAFTRIAETCISALLPHVIDTFATRHGPPPGDGMAVLALGKLGSAEMTATSDLDLITIYNAAGAEASDGPRPLAPGVYYPRLTQALVSALTAPTAEGVLYEVDMRLRPSGSQGPVAVSLAAFDGYHRDRAWVWEHLALTRARLVTGPPGLVRAIDGIIAEVLANRAGAEAILPEAARMHAKLVETHEAKRANPWSLKHAAGGMMEIEFLVQTGVLLHGLAGRRTVLAALPELTRMGWLSPDDAGTLADAYAMQQGLQQIGRVALEGAPDSATIGAELQGIFVRFARAEDIDALTGKLVSAQHAAATICAALLQADA